MRTTKLLTAVVVGLALLYSAGCDSCQTYYEYPVYNCPPGYQAPVVYEGCPPPPRAVQKQRRVRYARRTQRFARTGQPYVYVASDGTGTYQDLGTATLVNDPGYVPTVMVGAEGAVAPVVVSAPVVVQEPKPKTRVVYRRGRVQKRGRQARVTAPVYTTEPYAAPVYTAPSYYVSEPTAITPALLEPAVAEPVVAAEPVEAKAEEPSYAEFLAPEEEAPAEPAVAEAPAEPAVAAAEPQPLTPDIFNVPADAVPAVVPPIMPAPAVSQQMAQAYPVQDPQAMNTQQLQQLYQQRLAQLQELSLAIYQQQMSEQAGYQAGYQAPIVSEHMYAMAGPVQSGFEPGAFGTPGYCPPEICPVPVPIVCAPGQNLSECFTMNEYQMLNSPQVYTPEAMKPLPISVQPGVLPSTALINPSAPPTPTAPIAPAAPAARQVAAVAAPAAPAAPAVAPAQPVAAPGGTSKYEALVPPADLGRQQQNPPSVSMPAPLGNRPGSTTPPIAGTTEIENALDAMLARDPANPGMLK